MDLLTALRRMRQGEAAPAETSETDNRLRELRAALPSSADLSRSAESLQGPAPAMETPAGIEVANVESIATGKIVVLHGLAGVGQDVFNARMAVAGRKLRNGKFYAAGGDYQFAAIVDPANPLARVGLCMSRFGAGESLTAALHLREAMRLLPPLMETRLDLAKMMPPGAVEGELKILEERLTRAAGDSQAEPLLAFIAAFMHNSLGQTDQAKAAAAKIKATAGDDKLMGAFADYILTGNFPGHAATTQPAVK